MSPGLRAWDGVQQRVPLPDPGGQVAQRAAPVAYCCHWASSDVEQSGESEVSLKRIQASARGAAWK